MEVGYSHRSMWGPSDLNVTSDGRYWVRIRGMSTASHGLRGQTERQGYCLFLSLHHHPHSISSILTGLTSSLTDLAIRVWYCIQVEEQTRDLD